MAEDTNTIIDELKTGDVNISNDVVSIVASLAASSVKGVAGMVSSISGGIAELLGKKNMSKGVKVSVTNKTVTLDLSIIVEYGAKIPDVAWEIQNKVKSEVEAMTGLTVTAVNVSVEGVEVPKQNSEKIPPVPVDTDSAQSGEKTDDTQGGINIDDIVESAKEKAEDLADAAKDKAENFVDTVKDKAEEAEKVIKEKAADAAETVSEKAADIAEELSGSESDDVSEGPEAE